MILPLWYFILQIAWFHNTVAINESMLPKLQSPVTNIINISYIVEVIDAINNSKKIDGFTLVETNLLDTAAEDDISLFRQKMFQDQMKPYISVHNENINGTNLRISRILDLNSITVVFAINSEDKVLETLSDILRDFKLSIVMVVIATIFSGDGAIMSTVSQTLKTLAEANIVNSMVIYGDNAFKFDLYPTFKVSNITGEESSMNLSAEKNIDFQGYHVKTPIKKDIPRVFKAPQLKKIRGMTGWCFEI